MCLHVCTCVCVCVRVFACVYMCLHVYYGVWSTVALHSRDDTKTKWQNRIMAYNGRFVMCLFLDVTVAIF